MRRMLVTGAAGFIGSHLSEALVRRGDIVVGVDDFNDFYDPRQKERNVFGLSGSSQFSLVRGNLLDQSVRKTCFAQGPFDAVIHLAAWAGVRPSIERPAHYQRQNIEATVVLMDDIRMQEHKPRFIFASSSSVYGEAGKVPFSESDPVDHPVSPYAATKKCGELLAYAYHHLYQLDVTCLRFFTVYGARQRPEMAIHKFAKLLVDGRPVPRFGDGSSARDYTYITDIIGGLLASIDRCSGYNVYNLGNSRPVRLDELIAMLAAALGVPARFEELPNQPGDVPITFADITRAERDLGYRPRVPIEDGLADFARWFYTERKLSL